MPNPFGALGSDSDSDDSHAAMSKPNPFGALGSGSGSDSDSDSKSSVSDADGDDTRTLSRQRAEEEPEPELEAELEHAVSGGDVVQSSAELEDEMELRFASDDESEMGRSSAAATSKKQLKKLRKEQRRATRHAQSRQTAEPEVTAANFDSEVDCDVDIGCLSSSEYRSQHRVQFYNLGEDLAHAPHFAPVQTFEELTMQQMPSGVAIETLLVDACVSTIGGGRGVNSGKGYRPVLRPSPVQAECWGALLSGGAGDIVATSYTGSGKTLAFLLPIFASSRLATIDAGLELQPAAADQDLEAAPVAPQALVLAPTRELCQQIADVADAVCAYLEQQRSQYDTGVRVFCVVGGVDYATQRELLLSTRPTFVAATPGRLVALCGCVPASTRARQVATAAAAGVPPPELQDEEAAAAADSIVSLEGVRTLVLDEADRMLDLGFAEDIATVARLIATRRGESHPFLSAVVHPSTWMFSATWPQAAEALAKQLLLPNATHIVIGTQRDASGPDCASSGQKLVTAATVQQRFERIHGKGAPRARRLTELLEGILGQPADPGRDGTAELTRVDSSPSAQGHRVLVFVLYKKEATDIGKMLVSRGFSAVSLQGAMSQSARSRAMQAFRDGDASVLVATDVAARGLDVAAVTHVINFSFGLSIENYVHRVGRCGRAGRKGEAITFFIDGDEKFAPELLEVLHRSAIAAGQKLPVPSQWLREMAVDAVSKEQKQAAKVQKPLTEEEEEELERRMENRQRQRQQQQQKRAKERAGRGGGSGSKGGSKASDKAWKKNKKKK